MIKVKNLSVSYGKGRPDIIRNMEFELDKGSILNILGQNGVGKTTLIKTFMREIKSHTGTIEIDGREIDKYSIQEYAKKIGVVSTSYNTFQNLIVADYLETGFVNQMNPLSKPNDKSIKVAYDILRGFDKQHLFNKQINLLSSGERQIIMIARVLIQNPEIIIFDEPTANLDVKNQIEVLNHIKELSKQKYTIIVTSHNPGHALSMGGKTLIMGREKYCFGSTNEIITNEILSEYYELDVSMYSLNSFKCITFQNDNDCNSVKLVL